MDERPNMQPRQHLPTPDQYLAGLNDPNQSEAKSPFGPQPKKRRWIGKVLIILLLIGGLLGLHTIINLLRLSSNPFDFSKLKGEKDGRINILLLGVGDPGHAGANLSDTIMVASVDVVNNQMALISLPRDLRVDIPGYGEQKINSAHSDGGPDLARQVVEQTLGIPIHYYARVNFTGLRQAVDAVGGVDIDVQQSLYDPEYPCDNNQYKSCGLVIKKGQQHMNGLTALQYARCRKGNCGDDFGRALRQQEVLQSVRQKALSAGNLLNPFKINQLSTVLGDNIKTDLSVNQMLRLGKMIQGIGHDKTFNIVFSTDPGGFLANANDGGSDLLPLDGSFSDMQQFTQNVFKLGPIWVENPNIIIQNGTATPGVGAKLQDRITNDGYRITVVSLTNAPTSSFASSQIIDYTAGANPNTQRYLEGILGVKATPPPATVKNPPADFKVIVGADFGAQTTVQQTK